MTNEQKLNALEELMELDPGTLTAETVLEDVSEWDSIALISFIAMIDDEFDKIVKGKDVKAANTVSDLMAMMEN